MSLIDVYPFRNSNPSYVHSMRGEIDMNPVYQRQGEVWPVSKQKLLIDSILNDFDLPKLYFHELSEPRKVEGRRIQYALVDGKQRLGAIFDFIDGKFALADDFSLLRDESVNAAGLTFNELGEKYPMLQARFVSTALPIVVIRTDEEELIEEMFSRLNEAVPLNAPEKRNAFGGPAPIAVRELVKLPFFREKLPFTNNRYRHFDMAAKFLMWEYDWTHGNTDNILDTKKTQLDSFFVRVKSKGERAQVELASASCAHRVEALAGVFIDADPLLASVGMVSVYYVLHQDRTLRGEAFPSRAFLLAFEKARRDELPVEEGSLTRGHLAVFEFNRLAQSPNDASALAYRFKVLDEYTRALQIGVDPLQAVGHLAPVKTEKSA